MKQSMENLLSKFIRNKFLSRILDVTLLKMAGKVEDCKKNYFSSVYSKFQNYTRLTENNYCRNLTLIEKFRHLSGCIVECGVWRGGMIAGIAQVLGPQKTYYLFDSFEGLPEAKKIDGEEAMKWQKTNPIDSCRTEETYAYEAMNLSGVQNFEIIKGWFSKTLSNLKLKERIAILRLDADWYSSIAECLNYLYEQVIPGGLIIFDDYYTWDGCSKAIHDFLSINKLPDRIKQFDGIICYLVKKEDRSVKKINPNIDE